MRKILLGQHILPTSATMVGVCITAVGLVKVIESHTGPSHVDEYFALNSLFYLVSAVTSYFSMRAQAWRAIEICEMIADYIFMIGLCVTSLVAVLFAYEVI